MRIVSDLNGIAFFKDDNPTLRINGFDLSRKAQLKRYIINENATILFWDDDTKTISKRDKEDKFDKEVGFLFAYFYKKWGVSNNSRKRVLECIDKKYIKEFLLEFYVREEKISIEKARKNLSDLEVTRYTI